MKQNQPIKLSNHRPLKWKSIKKTRIWKLFIKGLIGFVVLIVVMFLWFSKDLPTPGNIDKKINVPSTQIYDRKGNLLYALSGNKKRFVVPLSDIPNYVKEATISLEDQNFYKNYGFDIKGILRSAYVDITHRGARQGGSTIPQQFVKNTLLTSDKSFSRKIKEVILAIELDAIYPKDKILELYLNEIPYGGTAYGIEAASRTYFGKSAKELTLAESATLAALPQAPTYYYPYGPNKDALMRRKNFALDRMVKLKYITSDQAIEAKKQEIVFQDRKDSIIAPHFVFYIQQLVADKYGEAALQNEGLKITTSLDLDIQKMAEEAIESNSKTLTRYNANNAALVSVEPKTGQVLAMVGSKDYFNKDIQGQVNVTTSKRQPGSSFKPIVYATAFKDKYNPAYPLFDVPTDFGGGYKPNNYDGRFHGPVSIRTALSNSLNIPAVKILSLVGVDNAINTARDLGITTLTDPKRYGLALVLGGGEVKPLEMAGAFGTFGNEGKFNPINPILKIEDKEGKIIEEAKEPDQKQVLDPQVAYLISDVLSDTEARRMVFGFTSALTIPGHRAAVKTGTTQANHDAWTVGYTPQISTAVWVGNTDNKEMKSGADGSVVAAPIWNSFMQKYLHDLPNEDFKRPAEIQQTTVDFLSNKFPSDDSPSDQKRFDIFASWNIPKNKDDIHVKVKINRLNGKLANDQTPASLIDEKSCANIRSERPEVANWENPVKTWSQDNGLYCSVPTETDDSYSIDKRPAVSITSPKTSSTLSGNFTVTTETQATYGVKEVIFRIDGQDIAKTSDAPYQVTLDTNNYSAGSHTLSAHITDNNGVESEIGNQVPVTFAASITAPATIPIISGINATSNGSNVTITWSTDIPTDGQVEYGLSSNLNQTSIRESNLKTNHSITIGGLQGQTTYYYKVNSRNQAGNSASSVLNSFQTK